LRQLLEDKSRRLLSSEGSSFLAGLEEVTGLLSRLEPEASPILQAVDAKGQDFGTYYFVAYSDTSDVDSSLAIYRNIKNLVRVVLLMDRFYEVGNQRYKRLGDALLSRLRKENDPYLKNTLTYSLRQFWPFWKFEQFTKTLMIRGHTFEVNDLRRFNLFKSSDAALIYAPLLESMLPNCNHNVSMVIHYNQALQDIDDDLDDVQEDLRDQMPNIFILAALDRGKSRDYSGFHRHRLNGSAKLILGSSAGAVMSLVDEYEAMVEGISVPEQFYFLKYLSRHYARTIRKKLAASRIDL
jgi:hypothetical protein